MEVLWRFPGGVCLSIDRPKTSVGPTPGRDKSAGPKITGGASLSSEP